MTVLSAQSIRERGIFVPFLESSRAHGRSYGLSSCGYDVRLAQGMWLWPLWMRLGSIIEHIEMPDDLEAEVKDKSSNARIGVFVQNTVIEPGWIGYLTVELTRFKPWPIYLARGTPIAQIIFHLLDKPTEKPYRGKYQHQKSGPQPVIYEAS